MSYRTTRAFEKQPTVESERHRILRIVAAKLCTGACMSRGCNCGAISTVWDSTRYRKD